MRTLPLLLCLAACQPVEGPPGPQGPSGEPGSPGPMGAPGKDGTGKQLHLIVADTGEDLGILVSPGGMAYNERVGAVVHYAVAGHLLYQDSDCRGPAMLAHGSNALQRIAVPGPTGTLLQVMGKPSMMHRRSILVRAGECVNADREQAAVPFADTGVPMPIRTFADGDLLVELR